MGLLYKWPRIGSISGWTEAKLKNNDLKRQSLCPRKSIFCCRPTWKRMTILSTPSSTPQLVIDVELSLPPPACTMVQEFLYLFLPNPSPTCSNFPGNFSLTDTHSNINGWPTSSPDQCRVTIPCCVSWSLFLCVSRGYLLFQPQMIRIFFFFHFILTNKLRGR